MKNPILKNCKNISICISALGVLFLSACNSGGGSNSYEGFEVKFLVGSALKELCHQTAEQFNATKPKLENGKAFYLNCEAKGSGDVVKEMTSLANQLKAGTLQPDDAKFPTLVSVDGEIYHSQLLYQFNQIFPGQNYIPEITDAPLLANSPMVFMAPGDVAAGLRKQEDLYRTHLGSI